MQYFKTPSNVYMYLQTLPFACITCSESLLANLYHAHAPTLTHTLTHTHTLAHTHTHTRAHVHNVSVVTFLILVKLLQILTLRLVLFCSVDSDQASTSSSECEMIVVTFSECLLYFLSHPPDGADADTFGSFYSDFLSQVGIHVHIQLTVWFSLIVIL